MPAYGPRLLGTAKPNPPHIAFIVLRYSSITKVGYFQLAVDGLMRLASTGGFPRGTRLMFMVFSHLKHHQVRFEKSAISTRPGYAKGHDNKKTTKIGS
jgi:hypothetical protein